MKQGPLQEKNPVLASLDFNNITITFSSVPLMFLVILAQTAETVETLSNCRDHGLCPKPPTTGPEGQFVTSVARAPSLSPSLLYMRHHSIIRP